MMMVSMRPKRHFKKKIHCGPFPLPIEFTAKPYLIFLSLFKREDRGWGLNSN
jgi:hypothetical protein